MNGSMVELSPELQNLVDERLDAIERILLVAGVSRGERRGILSEVEAHVFELLGRRVSGDPTRDDVLAVLAQLDPPESYAPEGFDPRQFNDALPTPPKRREPELSLLATGSAVAGVFLLFVLLMIVLAGADGVFVFFGAMLLLGVSTAGAWSLYRIQNSRGWLYGRRVALVATMLFPLVAINCFTVLLLDAMGEVAMFLGVAIAFLAINSAVIYGGWWLCEKLAKTAPTRPLGVSHAN